MDRPFILKLDPPRPCRVRSCTRPAALAICDPLEYGRGFECFPVCWEHTFFFSSVKPGREEIREQHQLICFMLCGFYNNCEAAEVVRQVTDFSEIPGYRSTVRDELHDFPDSVWLCKVWPQRKEQDVYVVWSCNVQDWILYPAQVLEQSS